MPKKHLFDSPVQKQTLAERLATEIENMIVSAELDSGANLPSETDLAQQYGVSRSVARDATRILMAKGLVEVQHGRGVFVSEPDNHAYLDAVLLALKRHKVTSWEIRQLEQHLYPQVVALALTQASDSELSTIKDLGQTYLEIYLSFYARWEEESFLSELEQSQIRDGLMTSFHGFFDALLKACHNKAMELFLFPILRIRTLSITNNHFPDTPPPYFGGDVHNFRQFLVGLETRDVTLAQSVLSDLLSVSAEDQEKMENSLPEAFPLINRLI
jgi:GntR family transcriptional repressor for pyruvate dehydrogenase complex